MLKTLKRKIALVAVAALGAGGLSIVAAPSALANTPVNGTVAVAPVRVTFTGTVQDVVPAAPLTFTAPATWTAADLPGAAPDALIRVTLTRAPSANAILTWDHSGKARFTNQGGGGVANDFTVTLADTGEIEANGTNAPTFADTTTGFTFAADTAGTYAGTITVDGDTTQASDVLTVPFLFTTTGAVASLRLSATSVAVPAIIGQTNTYELSVLDANGNLTQPQTVDSASAAIADATNIWLGGGATTEAVTAANLADGKHTLTVVARTAVADSEVITITPAGTIGGLAAATLTANSAAEADYTGDTTALTEPTLGTVARLVTGTTNDYQMDPSRITGAFKVTGLTVGRAYRIKVTYTDAAGADYAGTLQLNARTAVATAGSVATDTVAGIADATTLDVTWALSTATNLAAADTVIVELGAGAAPAALATTGARVTYTATTYTVAVTTPAVTPISAKTGTALAMAGTVKDLWGNAVPAASVTVTGTQTSPSGAAAITRQASTNNAGEWSLTMPAAAADATVVSYVAAATKPGLTIASAAAIVVNFNATGEATAITITDAVGDEDTATTVDKYPAIKVPFDGVASGVTADSYDVSDAGLSLIDHDAAGGTATERSLTVATAANSECAAVQVTTTPAAQITVTGSAGVLFYTTACAGVEATHSVAAGKATVNIASAGAANLWITSTKTGLNTYTVTSGPVSKTYSFWAVNYEDQDATGIAARNVALTLTKASIAAGELGRGTLKVTDAFGNAVALHGAAGVSVSVSITGDALLDGPAVTKSYTTTSATGEAFFGVLGGTAAGSAVITATGAGAKFGAAAGADTGTTAGTTGLTASTRTATVTQTITAGSAAANPAIDAVKADVKAVSDTVATLSKAVTTIQSSVTELTSSFSAQIKSLSSAIAKISRAIAALSKRIK